MLKIWTFNPDHINLTFNRMILESLKSSCFFVIMIEYFPLIWAFVAVLIPLMFIIISIVGIIKKTHPAEIIAKLFWAFLLYLPVTLISGWYIASLINSLADSGQPKNDGIGRGWFDIDFTSSLVVFGYTFFGFVLCWFVNKGFIDILSFFESLLKKLD